VSSLIAGVVYSSSEVVFLTSIKSLMSSIFEMNSYEEIVKRQISNRSIYGPALSGNGFKYKYELLSNIHPDIIILGSSRTMQFKEEMFNGAFANAGGAVNHIAEGILFADRVKSKVAPKIVLVGLDVWWFNKDLLRQSFPEHNMLSDQYSEKKLSNLIDYLGTGKVDYEVFRYIIKNDYITNPYTKHDSLGLRAIKYGDGFRADGSRLYTSTVYGANMLVEDVGFSDTYDRISKGERRFNYGSSLSVATKTIFMDFISHVRMLGGEVIFFLPPFSGTVNDFMHEKGAKYSYIYDLKEWLNTLDIILFDYSDVRSIGANDCEFIDGFHGGDVVSQRILLDIAKNRPSFRQFINIDLLKNNIENYTGRTLTPEFSNSRGNIEVDFLQLGCNKGLRIN